jgi:hypothetical protein
LVVVHWLETYHRQVNTYWSFRLAAAIVGKLEEQEPQLTERTIETPLLRAFCCPLLGFSPSPSPARRSIRSPFPAPAVLCPSLRLAPQTTIVLINDGGYLSINPLLILEVIWQQMNTPPLAIIYFLVASVLGAVGQFFYQAGADRAYGAIQTPGETS